jgi:hypothetical protein
MHAGLLAELIAGRDPGIAAADELVLFLPPAFGLEENVRVLADMAQTVGPALGWAPAR